MKELHLEWRHLDKDGKTCDRCSDTGETVRSAYQALAAEFQPKGWKVTFKEILLTENEIPESNAIYVNGIPIEQLLPNARKSENCCISCGDLLGSPTMCRTIEQYGQTYEAIPAALILKAAHLYIQKHDP